MRKYKKIIISVISIVLVIAVGICGYFSVRFFGNTIESEHDYNEIYSQEQITVQADDSGIYRVLKINDTHMYNGTCENDKKTLEDLKVILDKTPCDFIVADGDIVDGFNLNLNYDKEQALRLFGDLVDSYGIKWTFVPGNNDGEIDGENEDIIAYFMKYDNFVYGNTKGIDGDMQFFVDIEYNSNLVHSLAFMDSHARTIKAIGKYDHIKENQINWLLDGINNRKVKTSVFFHMNTPAFEEAYNNEDYYESFGTCYMFPMDSPADNSMFDKMTEKCEYISLISVGHIHSNYMASFYNGRYYQLSSISGYNASYNDNISPSCTLTTIDLTKTEVKDMYHFEHISA